MRYKLTIDRPDIGNEFTSFGKRGDRRQYVMLGDRLVIVTCKNNIRLDHLSVSTHVFAVVGNDNGLHVAVPDNHIGQFHTKITIIQVIHIGDCRYDQIPSSTFSHIIERAPIGRDNTAEEIAAGRLARERQAVHNASHAA